MRILSQFPSHLSCHKSLLWLPSLAVHCSNSHHRPPVIIMDLFLDNMEKEWERIVNRERALVKSGPPKGSVRMKALMLELNFPVQVESRDRGSGYNYGKKWTYLNGKQYYQQG